MTDDKKYRIAVLAEDAERKRIRYEALGLMNTPTDPEARIKASVEYQIAHAELIEANQLLTTAKYTV